IPKWVPGSAFSPAASMPATAHISSLSEVSPEMPQAPTILPEASLISTPPGLVTMRPWLAAASMVKNCGVFAARPASVREPKPMPSAPQALPYAISKRRMPDLSSRLKATRWPPESSTATVSGARLLSRAFFKATSTMVEACARVTDMLAPVLGEKPLLLAAARPIDRLPRGVAGTKTLVVGLLERRQRRFRRRHVGALGGAGGDHGFEVLHRIGDAERGRAGIAVFHHGDDHVGAQLEAVVGAVALGKQVDEALWLPTEVAYWREGFGVGLPA